MRSRKIKLVELIWIGYFLGVVMTSWWRGGIVIPGSWLEIGGLLVGGGLGWWLVELDKLVYGLISHPQAQVSQYARYYFSKKDYRRAWQLLKEREGEMVELSLRSGLFQAAWVVIAVFALTSTVGWFGKGLVMGLGGHILLEEWEEWRKDKEGLKRRLFWQVKREISNKELKGYMWVMTGIFAWLTWLLV